MIERYQTEAMAGIWNDDARFARWTRVEVAACAAFHARGEIPDAEMATIRAHAHHQSAARVREIEATTHHDVVAFVRALSESVGEPASRHLHRGLTSSDVIDTALAIALRDALDVLLAALDEARDAVAKRAIEHKYTACIGRTHGIHAEPTTFGLRLAGWYTELGRNKERLGRARESISYGKLSGAVGSFSQTDPDFEQRVLESLGLQAEPVATQVIPRDRHADVMNTLALLGAAIERFATEIRSLQRTDIREVEEPFRSGQTGSSAMPHKRNPILSERLTGMARLLRGGMVAACENVALWHDRDISHSSVERVSFPDAFHLCHYMLRTLKRLVEGLRIYPERMRTNIDATGGLVFSQSVLGALLQADWDRQAAYAVVQRAAMQIWEGQAASFRETLLATPELANADAGLQARIAQAFDLNNYFRNINTLFARAGLE
mgnify:CR=1 FL=1